MNLANLRHSLYETFPTRASEWALALMLFGWSIILSANTDLFATLDSYAQLASVFSQGTWARVCLVLGLGRLVVLIINGAWRRTPHLRAIAAFLSIFFWFTISMGLAQAGTWATGLAVYPVLALLDTFNFVRILGEAARVDRYYRQAAEHHGSDD